MFFQSVRWRKRVPSPLARRGALLAVYSCVLASLWRAPVPWLHAHDSLDPRTAVTQFWHEHLKHFHTQPEPRDPPGWHWHFVWPWELADQPDDSAPPGGIPRSWRVVSEPMVPAGTVSLLDELPGRRLVLMGPAVRLVAPDLGSCQFAPAVGLPLSPGCRGSVSWQSLACIARC